MASIRPMGTHAYEIQWREAEDEYVWQNWYTNSTLTWDIQSTAVRATRYYPFTGHITTGGTITTADINQASYRWNQAYTVKLLEAQAPTWQQWERYQVRERETFEQEQARLLREQELQDRIQRDREERSRRRLAEQARIEGAQGRALELLEMILTPEERMYRATQGELMVRGSFGGMYVIEERDSVHGNVRQVDEHGCNLGRICVAPQMYDGQTNLALPLADGWVGQYLAIKHDEITFRAKGNWSGRRACQHQDVPVLRAA